MRLTPEVDDIIYNTLYKWENNNPLSLCFDYRYSSNMTQTLQYLVKLLGKVLFINPFTSDALRSIIKKAGLVPQPSYVLIHAIGA